MQELIDRKKDLYDELGTYQIAFLLNERTKQINYPDNSSEELKQNLEILEKLETYIRSLKEYGQSNHLVDKYIRFARFLFELHEEIKLSNLKRLTRIKIMEFLTLLLNLLATLHFEEEFTEIAIILFEQKLEKALNYNPNHQYLEIDQDILGLMRSKYLNNFHLERAKELKRMRKN